MIARLRTLGLNYTWGLINFTAGVVITAAVVGFAAGLGSLCR